MLRSWQLFYCWKIFEYCTVQQGIMISKLMCWSSITFFCQKRPKIVFSPQNLNVLFTRLVKSFKLLHTRTPRVFLIIQSKESNNLLYLSITRSAEVVEQVYKKIKTRKKETWKRSIQATWGHQQRITRGKAWFLRM